MSRDHYAIVLTLDEPRDIEVGALGELSFAPGDYVYIGRARRGLDARLGRHRRSGDKTLRWHIDYLRQACQWVEARLFDVDDECALAERIAGLSGGERWIERFGASDCRCAGHLVWFADGAPALGGLRWSGGR